MKRNRWMFLLALCGIACLGANAQEKGEWRPVGTAAKFTTGYVSLADNKLSFDHATFTTTLQRPLTRHEISIIFMLETPPADSGNLYRLKIPKAKHFLHGNAVCDGEDADWLATHVHGDVLELYFFTGLNVPDFSEKAQRTTSGPCGAFGYARATASPTRFPAR